jgi:hypothetical protein
MEPGAATMGGAAYPERGAASALRDSFIGISKAHTTNLAVAPGIAEALGHLKAA